MNRNFPAGWDAEEYGAGEHPLSEPEAAAVARFILDHPNIAGMNSYHTHGGIILRPSMTQPDASMSPKDLALYTALGKVGTELTGYPTISIYEEFTPDKSKPRRGGLMDWTYEKMGIPSFATEVWDIETAAGVEKTAYYNLHPRTEEAQLKVFQLGARAPGRARLPPLAPFQHPQLGEVEMGGMNYIWTYRNPPPALLEEVCRANVAFNLKHAAAAPRVRVDDVTVEALGGDLYQVRAVVANHGYLPTNLSDVAIQRQVAKPVAVELELEGAELVMNPRRGRPRSPGRPQRAHVPVVALGADLVADDQGGRVAGAGARRGGCAGRRRGPQRTRRPARAGGVPLGALRPAPVRAPRRRVGPHAAAVRRRGRNARAACPRGGCG
jgi:hypothetical protein